MRQKVELLADASHEERGASTWTEPDFASRFTVSDDDIELAFLREKQNRRPS
jgi:hypothetical protein